ncbi:MAG: NAD(P)H-hydrate dehydratase [Lachnospiraceae bacterium]|nr:NAD(P)H-hydrate dehydratase [Lachnospiraceae bacterium]
MQYAVTAAEMKQYDRETILRVGIPSLVLMERAALETVRILCKERGRIHRALILAGTGNNGGDGLAVGRILASKGIKVTFLLAGNWDKLSEETARQKEILLNSGFSILRKLEDGEYDIVIDALLGIGLSREVEGEYAELIKSANAMKLRGAYICSVDIPSGICADTGRVMGCAVKADLTTAFAFAKRGELLYPGREYAGKLVVCDIGIPGCVLKGQSPAAVYPEREDAFRMLPARRPDGNKGTFGKVLLIAGSYDMCGACILAGSSIFKAGAGMVKIITPQCNREILQSTLPEAMLYSYQEMPETRRIQESLEWADVAAIGPGMGTGKAAEFLLMYCLENSRIPMVLDADALNLIGREQKLAELLAGQQGEHIVLTPHPGELVRLSGLDMECYRADRMKVIGETLQKYDCTLVAKDAVTLTIGRKEGELLINTSGNDGMAAAGSGDVLTGIISGLLAQKMPCFEAAGLSVFLHGLAGEAASKENGRYGMTAMDIVRHLPDVMCKTE